MTFTAFDADGTRVDGSLPGGEFDLSALAEPVAAWVQSIGIPLGLVRPATPEVKEEA